ncbi:MAG: phage tail assembly chaperone [Alphaproteobacteria bacterium]|nr:phage tail assembly chaperone [Alphaproteobacteria bacterium]
MRLGLGLLAVPADVFWRLSVPEWRALSDGAGDRLGLARLVPPMARTDLRTLMNRFPDEQI